MIRRLEVLVVLLSGLAVIERNSPLWLIFAVSSALLQIWVEGFRFHLYPFWAAFVFLFLAHVFRSTFLFWLTSAIAGLLFVLGLVLIYVFPLFSLPKPSGPYTVGIRDVWWKSDGETFSARLYYPAAATATTAASSAQPAAQPKRLQVFGARRTLLLRAMAQQLGRRGMFLPYVQHIQYIDLHALDAPLFDATAQSARAVAECGRVRVVVFSRSVRDSKCMIRCVQIWPAVGLSWHRSVTPTARLLCWTLMVRCC